MPLDRDTRVVPSNVVLDRGRLGVGAPSSQRCRLTPNYFGSCYKVGSVRRDGRLREMGSTY